MFVASAFGFHFCNDLRISEHSEGVNRTVFDVDMNLAGVLDAICRSIETRTIDKLRKLGLVICASLNASDTEPPSRITFQLSDQIEHIFGYST